ncbi:hypothetical protein JCM8208_007525 [Rhodotorula glutinis]
MSSPAPSPQQQADRLFFDKLASEMRRLGPQLGHEFDPEANADGMLLAGRVGLTDFINRLCLFFGRYCLHAQAREGVGPYYVKLDQVFVLGGCGLDNDPTVVVVPSFDELVHTIHRLDDKSFSRFSVPHAGALDPTNGPLRPLHYIVGPTVISHDGVHRAIGTWNPDRRFTNWGRRFIDGGLGAKGTPYQIDSDCDLLGREPLARGQLIGSKPPLGLRAIWTFLSPHDAGEAADAEGNPTSKSAVWSLELDVPGQPMAFYRVIFSQDYATRLGLADHIIHLCAFFEHYIVNASARDGMAPYHITPDKLFVLGGKGLDDDPTVVVVPSFDELVHVIRRTANNEFIRFSVPHPDALDDRLGPLRKLCHVAGPTPIPHDGDTGPRHLAPLRRVSKWQARFIQGELGANKTPYQIDSDAALVERDPAMRRDLLGYERPDGLRVIWTLLAPHDAETAANAEGKPANKSATWSLELEVPGQPMAVYKVIFSQDYVRARAKAESVTRAQFPHVALARGPW